MAPTTRNRLTTSQKARSRAGSGGIYYDRERDRYRAQVRVDGKRVTIGTARTEREAQELLNAAARGDVKPTASIAWSQAPSDGRSVADVVGWWRDEILPTRELAPSTEAGYRWAVGEIVDGLGPCDLGALTTLAVQVFLTDRAARLSRNSVRILRVALNLALDAAVRFDFVGRNVARAAVLPKTARKPVARAALSEDEVCGLTATMGDSVYGHLFALALHTGARRGELLALAWSSVDLDGATMLIRQGLRKNDDGRWSIGPTKTEASIRTVRLSGTAVEHLRARRAQQRVEQIAARSWSNSADLVFTSPTGAHLDPRKVNRQWRATAEAAGLAPGAVLHELRHTLGSHMVESGAKLADVADQMGHSTLDEVSRVYRHRVAAVVEGGANVIDEILARKAAER